MSESHPSGSPSHMVCKKCEERKPIDEFATRNKGKYRRKSCRACVLAQSKEWRKNNRDAYLEARRANWQKNKDSLNAARRTPEKRERSNELRRKKRAADPEPERQRARAYRAKNRDKARAWHRRWYEKHGANWYPEYRRLNPERVRDMNHRRRAATKDPCGETLDRIAAILSLPCAYCGSDENIEVDHIVPLSRGGEHVPENLAPACQRCNRSKHNKLLSEWKGVI